jgi:alkylation response protein AidB-like acyl-CoA dehydrogenase
MSPEETALVEAVAELARTKFAERAGAVDREGSFPADNMRELQHLKVPGMGMPESAGGGGMGAEARVRVTEAVAYGCGSTAVALNMHFFTADFLLLNPAPNEAAQALLHDVAANHALICGPGSIAMTGLDARNAGYRAVQDAEGLTVNGKSGFASMSDGATYAFLAGTVDRGEGVDPDLFFAVPRLDLPGISNMHNWDAMGFRGTASNDIVCEGLRIPADSAIVVPANFMEMLNQLATALPANVRQGRSAGVLGIMGIWLGLSQAALDFTRTYVTERYGATAFQGPGPAPGFRADDAWAQIGLGEMSYWVRSGRALLYDFVNSLETPYESNAAFNEALGVVVYHMRRMSEEVAMTSMRVCGAHAYVRSRPLERIFRDLMGCVVMAWKTDGLAQQLGLAALGRPFFVGGPIAAGG